MKEFTHLKLRGWLGTVLCIIAAAVTGVAIFLLGLNGLENGEVTIKPKGLTPFIANANGPNAFDFHLHVWGLILFGAFLVCCSLATTLFLIFSPRARRNAALLSVGTTRASGTGTEVPGWFAAAVLIGLVSTFVFIAIRFS